MNAFPGSSHACSMVPVGWEEERKVKQVTMYSGKRIGQGIALVLLLALLLCDGTVASAQATLTAEFFSPVDPRYSYTVTFTSLEGLINSLTSNPLQGHLSGFNQNTDQINVYSNAGGLAVTILAPQDSSSFTVSVPGLGYTKNFTGADRSASTTSMIVWAVTDPDGIVAKVNAQVEAAAALAASGEASDTTGCFISTIR